MTASTQMSGLQVFTEEQVDAAILEVGLGGRLDATNCIPSPPVCGVTSLGMDHVEILGDTIEVSLDQPPASTIKRLCLVDESPR